MGILNVQAPLAGVVKNTAFQKQPPFSTFKSLNIWPQDVISGREVSASRPPIVEFESPDPTNTISVNLLSTVNGDATQSPQFSMVSARDGILYWWDGDSWVEVTSASSVTTGRTVFAPTFLKRVIVLNDTTPLVFNYDDLTFVPFVADEGTVPADCRVGAVWSGALWVAGALEQPHVFSCSRTNDIFDWDFSVPNTDLGGAYTSTGEDGGFILEPITALIPVNADTMIIACVDEMWALRRHPRRGGSLEKLPEKIGVLGNSAWTFGPNGEVYFASRHGIGVLDAAGTQPTLLSRKVIPADLIGLPFDYTDPKIVLEYSPLWDGVHITVRGDEGQAWWMDLGGSGISFHPEKWPFNDHPVSSVWFGSIETEAASGVLFGTQSGIKRFDSLGTEDMASELVVGPFRISESDMEQSRIMEVMFRFLDGTTDSPNTSVGVVTGVTGDDVVSRYESELGNFRTTTTMSTVLRNGGRVRALVGGSAALLTSASFGGDRIVFEGAELNLEPHGRSVWIPKQTQFEEPLTDTVIGLGWLLGGVYAYSTGDTPTANHNNFSLWVDLADLPDAWWDEVAFADGRDIRGTTLTNALRPIDLIDFNLAARTGFLVVRHSLVNTVGPLIRIWCGNPLASQHPVGGPFGQYNAYPSDQLLFAPDGGGNDRTRNRNHLVSLGGVVSGDVDGPEDYVSGTRYGYGGISVFADFVFDSSGDTTPEAGEFSLTTAGAQNAATEIHFSVLDNDGVNRTTAFQDTPTVIRVQKKSDPTKFIFFGALLNHNTNGTRFTALQTVAASSGANPFTNGDVVTASIQQEYTDPPVNSPPRALRELLTAVPITECTIMAFSAARDGFTPDVGVGGFTVRLGGNNVPNPFVSELSLIRQMAVSVGGVFTSTAHAVSLSEEDGTGLGGIGPLTVGTYFHTAIVGIETGFSMYLDGAVYATSSFDTEPFDAAFINVGAVSAVGAEIEQDISLIQVFTTGKSTAFIAYQHAMLNQPGFWDGWVMGDA